MKNYRKLIAAIVGVGALILARYGITIEAEEIRIIIDGSIALITLIAIERLPNLKG